MEHHRATAILLALLALTFAAGSRPAGASGCPDIKPLMSIAAITGTPTSGAPGHPDEGAITVGQCVTFQLLVVRASGNTSSVQDVTNDPNTRFVADLPQGADLFGNVFCATSADCNRAFPIYGIYHDPCTGTDQVDTVHIHVEPCSSPAPLSITCPAAIAGIPNETGLCGAHVSFANPAITGGTPPAQVVCSPASGSFFPVGVTPVTCTATDAAGKQARCSFTVSVGDTEKPTITCPADITQSNDAGQCGAVVTYPAPTVTDNCSGVSVSCSPASGSFFPVGTTPVTCTATDAAGSTAHCSFNVTVRNTQGPTITCPADISLQAASGASSAAVALGSPTVTDPCSGVMVTGVRSDFQSLGALFPLGTTTVTWTATDASGNTVACRQSVTVTALAPAVTVPAVTLSRSSIAFDQQSVGSSSSPQTFTITNTGNANLVINGIQVSGANPQDFVVTPNGSTVLTPGTSLAISVVFTPQGSGSRSATLLISTNASPTPFVVQLSGTGGSLIQPQISVGQPVASNLRLEIFGVDVLSLDGSASAIFHVGSDGSLYVRDYAGTALIRIAPGGGAGQVLLDTTHQDNPSLGDHTDGVGLSRLLNAEANVDDTMATVALRADNSLGIYHLDPNGRVLQLGVDPDASHPTQMAMSDHDQVAYVAANASGALTLFQSTGEQAVPILSVGQTVNGATVVGFSDAATSSGGDLTANAAGDLAFRVLLRQADGTPAQAILRKTSAGLQVVAITGQPVPQGSGASATGALTTLLHPLIGPDESVVFAGGGAGFANFFVARPGQLLQPLLSGSNWNLDPATFSFDLAADGTVALLAAPAGSMLPSLYLIPPGGAASPVVSGRRDIQPLGRPAFVPGGNGSLVFFLAQNLDYPLDRNNRPLVGLYRARTVNGSLVVEPVGLPGQSVPHLPGLAPNTTPVLLSLTQRPVVTTTSMTFGILYGTQNQSSPLSPLDYLRSLPVPTAALFQIPLLGTLADGQPIAPEGSPVMGSGALAQLRSLSFRADHTLDALALLPGAGPVIVPSAAPAGVAGRVRTQAVPQASIQPLLATGDSLGLSSGESLEYVLPPLLPLGTDQELFVARFHEAGTGEEGYFTLGTSSRQVQPVQSPFAVTSMSATADTLFNHFSYASTSPMPDLNILDPPSIFFDGTSLNVVFKAILNGKPGTSLMTTLLSGVFQWNGSNAVNAVDLSNSPTPVTLEHWAAGKAGAVYLQVRDASRSHLYARAAGAPLQLVTAAEGLADLFDFVLSSDGTALFVIGKDARGSQGLFRIDLAHNTLTPLRTASGLVTQGQPVPPPAYNPGATGLKFSGSFTLDPSSAHGPLLFYAPLAAQNGGSAQKVGLFQLDPSSQVVVPEIVEDLAESSARSLTATILQPTTALNNSHGTLAYADEVNGLWVLWRSRAKLLPNGQPALDNQGNQIYFPPEPLAQAIGPHGERRGDLNGANPPAFAALDASLVLTTPDQPAPPGPVFALGDDDGVAFLASDGKRWGVYRTTN